VTSELLDSTIVIDHLNGIPEASATISALDDPAISVITWIEVVAGLRDAESESVGRRFIATLELVQLSPPIAEETVRVRRERNLKLPDAIIWATARHLGCPLVTRNTKDFPEDDPDVLVPYRL
jgi:predicted nucleic acid-binding protein